MIRIENLKLLLKQEQWTNSHLASLLGVSPQYVGKLLNKKTAFTEKTARKIEDVAGRPRGWLDVLHIMGDSAQNTNDAPADSDSINSSGQRYPMVRGEPNQHVVMESALFATNTPRAPVVEWATLDENVLKSNRDWPVDAYMAFTPIVNEVSDYVKIATVIESPLPTISVGDKIAIDSKAKPWDDCVVVARTATGKLILRRYRSLALNGFELVCPNEPPLDHERHGVSIVGVVVGLNKMKF